MIGRVRINLWALISLRLVLRLYLNSEGSQIVEVFCLPVSFKSSSREVEMYCDNISDFHITEGLTSVVHEAEFGRIVSIVHGLPGVLVKLADSYDYVPLDELRPRLRRQGDRRSYKEHSACNLVCHIFTLTD